MQLAILRPPAVVNLGARAPWHRLFNKLSRLAFAKRNPRDATYMKHLAAATLGEACRFVEAGPDLAPELLRAADEIVLLWPDGNGYGWAPLERAVFRHKAPPARVLVLNGRRRQFEL